MSNKHTSIQNMILFKKYNIHPVLSLEQILFHFMNFIKEINSSDNPYIYLLIKLEGEDEDFNTIHYSLGRRIPINIHNNKDIQKVQDSIKKSVNELNDYYLSMTLKHIIFNYSILSEDNYLSLTQNLNKNEEVLNLKKESLLKKLSYPNLPVVFDQLNQNYKDKRLSTGLFKRTLTNGVQLFYKNNKIDLLLKEVSGLKYMNQSVRNTQLSNKIMTLDIETFLKENIHIPYCISTYYNDQYKTFLLNEDNNLYNSLFEYLFQSKFNQYIIYIHNSSAFDMVFLLKEMTSYHNVVKVNPIIKDNKFINLEVFYKINNKTYKISFRDSYLLLSSSLSKLSKAFNINNPKGIFPYSFVNSNNLHYDGIVPDYVYFDSEKVSLNEYLNYKQEFIDNNLTWNLLEQTTKYCELDCKALFEIITSFQQEIFELFSIDINKTPTLPSLAFKIFRTHYLMKNQIPLITGKLYKILTQAYYGGHVDMYIPSNVENNKQSLFDKVIQFFKRIYHYDINSLYPAGMKLMRFPVGKITHFIPRNNDSLSLISKDYKFGIFRVNVDCPKDLLHPILPIKINHNCVYPVGTWQGWYQSEELANAEKYGYKYEILEGYLFEGEYIFKDYIDKLYEIKVNSQPNTPHYVISKLLMNSLYGRFAMDPHLLNYKIVDTIDQNNPYEDVIKLKNKYLLSYYNEEQSYSMNINIAIGLSVTAYARIIMSIFKNNPKLTGLLYYTDTDSIFCDKELPLSFIGKALGKMKLEHTLNNFVALAPKVYGGIDLLGKSFTKVKGLKNTITFTQLSELLSKPKEDIKPFTQEKWYKDYIQGTIEVKQIPYILTPTQNKRILIYKDNKLIGTESIELKDGQRIN
uniref:DNA polymerase n=1 Tax=Schizopora paradoxa TaxID=27342 RepID=A0A5B9RKH8_9AGAM|nr:DNA polymerase family B [Schizopora paradoxa]QEG57235.1 DNA polymerase family B [Schizopora paradoxa]